jgi:putative hydrolase of the HAD superfamily
VIDGDKTLDNFQHGLEVLGFMPEEILVIGDRIKSEIILANQMGMKTVWYKSGKFAGEAPESEDEEPDWVVGELGEVIQIAQK